MKLFDDFEAVRFPEENLIFITHGGYLYYIYDVECCPNANMRRSPAAARGMK